MAHNEVSINTCGSNGQDQDIQNSVGIKGRKQCWKNTRNWEAQGVQKIANIFICLRTEWVKESNRI